MNTDPWSLLIQFLVLIEDKVIQQRCLRRKIALKSLKILPFWYRPSEGREQQFLFLFLLVHPLLQKATFVFFSNCGATFGDIAGNLLRNLEQLVERPECVSWTEIHNKEFLFPFPIYHQQNNDTNQIEGRPVILIFVVALKRALWNILITVVLIQVPVLGIVQGRASRKKQYYSVPEQKRLCFTLTATFKIPDFLLKAWLPLWVRLSL